MADLPKIPGQPNEAELSDFLSKVDEIESVIKGLNSQDDEERGKYMSKADELIEKVKKSDSKKTKKTTTPDNDDDDDNLPQTRIGFSKTSINKDAYKNEAPPPQPQPQGPMGPEDQKAFMAMLEADANDRAQKKKEREKIAMKLKEQGNTEFRQGNYKKALEFYDKAMEQIRDNSTLYTNRAQAKIKLGMYTEALTDCDWALRVWENCMKAYVHQGHAYLGLKEYEKARESYRKILNIDSKKENIVKDYIAEVDRAELASQAEAKAAQLFEEGDQMATGVVDLLTRINKPDQLPLYYAGGFRVIANAMEIADSQTLFRTNNGLQLPTSHPVLKRCLTACIHSLSKEERDLVTAALEMLTAASKDNETSQQQLLNVPDFPSQLLGMLEAKFKGHGRLLKTSCLNLFHEISTTAAGRAALLSKFDANRLMKALFPLMMKKSTYASTAAALMNNLALEKRLKAMLRDNIQDDILPAFENLLQSNKTTPAIAGMAASVVTNLAGDITIRNKMAASRTLWSILSTLLLSYSESKLCSPVEDLLGLTMNLSTGVESSSLKDMNLDLTNACFTIMTSHDLSEVAVTRSLAVLSNIMPFCAGAVKYMSEGDRPLTVLEFVKNPDPLYNKSALRCMTALTQDSDVVRNVVADNKGTSVIMNFLNSEDEVVIGNAALCLSHLCQVGKVCAKLTKTNIIQRLLVLARDGRKPSVQSNCAILIGKLAQGDSRHLEKLRELHGIEILHGCMKHVK